MFFSCDNPIHEQVLLPQTFLSRPKSKLSLSFTCCQQEVLQKTLGGITFGTTGNLHLERDSPSHTRMLRTSQHFLIATEQPFSECSCLPWWPFCGGASCSQNSRNVHKLIQVNDLAQSFSLKGLSRS